MLLKSEVYETIQNLWKNEALTGLQDFIRLPALSRAFDPEWESKGILKQALVLAKDWGKVQLPHATFEILESPTIPPALKIRIPLFKTTTANQLSFMDILTNSLKLVNGLKD